MNLSALRSPHLAQLVVCFFGCEVDYLVDAPSPAPSAQLLDCLHRDCISAAQYNHLAAGSAPKNEVPLAALQRAFYRSVSLDEHLDRLVSAGLPAWQ